MVAGPALLLWIALAPVAANSPRQEGESPRQQAQRILDDGHYQQTPPSDLTVEPAGETGSSPGDSENRSDRSGSAFRNSGSSALIHAPLLVPIVVGALLLLLLLLGVTRKGGLAEERRHEPLVEPQAAVEAAAPIEPGDPDALAAEGRFAEAIHALLLRALRGLARSVGGFARGLTSREILPRAPAGEPRAALEELVASVERHEFGAQPLSAADFERCRSAAVAAAMLAR